MVTNLSFLVFFLSLPHHHFGDKPKAMKHSGDNYKIEPNSPVYLVGNGEHHFWVNQRPAAEELVLPRRRRFEDDHHPRKFSLDGSYVFFINEYPRMEYGLLLAAVVLIFFRCDDWNWIQLSFGASSYVGF